MNAHEAYYRAVIACVADEIWSRDVLAPRRAEMEARVANWAPNFFI